jgi:alpha-L-fucosidase 2
VAPDGRAAAEIDLLPSLPSAWPAGSARGLRARGGVEVAELSWAGGRLTRIELVSKTGGSIRLRHGNAQVTLATNAGERIALGPGLNRIRP